MNYRNFWGIILGTKKEKACDILFTELKLKDRDKYLSYYNHTDFPHSQHCFTTMYIWRHLLKTRFDIVEGNFCSVGTRRNGETFLSFPVGSAAPAASLEKLFSEFGDASPVMCATADMCEKLDNKEAFSVTDARYNYDYVYETDKLISLSGKKLHSKKNHVNKFIATYKYFRFDEISKSNIKDCMALTDMWFERKYTERDAFANAEYSSIVDLLENMDPLECKGLILYSDSKPIAYSVGEYLSADTAVIHIEKADTDFDGSYAMINNLMAKHVFSDTTYINREEDMDLEPLRKAKLSYRPHHFVEVCNLRKK